MAKGIKEIVETGQGPGLKDSKRSKLEEAKRTGNPYSEKEAERLEMQKKTFASEHSARPGGKSNFETQKGGEPIRLHQPTGAPFPIRVDRIWKPK